MSAGADERGWDAIAIHPDDDVAVALSYPDWIVERLTADLGADDAEAALAAMNEPAAVTLRHNALVVTADALEAEMRSLAIDAVRGELK